MHDNNTNFTIDNPQMGTFLTVILAFTTIATTSFSLQGLDLILGILAKLGAIFAAGSTVYAAYQTVKASKKN